MKTDVYEKISAQIITQLEHGVRPWCKPWDASHTGGRITRPLRANGQPYRGINVLLLWSAMLDHGYRSPSWMTFKQAQELGGHVRKGDKGHLVVFANTLTKTETDEAGEENERTIPFLKGYTVFNADQVEGLPERFYAAVSAGPTNVLERVEAADAFIRHTGAQVRHGGSRAYYTKAADVVQMPPFEAFADREAYYATLLHELTHWTKGAGRLERELGRKRWGDQGYAMEELVAELGAAFLCADLGLSHKPRDEHAAYIASWLKVLNDDKRAIFAAAAHAQSAADYLHSLQPFAGADILRSC